MYATIKHVTKDGYNGTIEARDILTLDEYKIYGLLLSEHFNLLDFMLGGLMYIPEISLTNRCIKLKEVYVEIGMIQVKVGLYPKLEPDLVG